MGSSPPGAIGRRGYFDWLRGVAVVLMIQAHLFDSWTREPDRHTASFSYVIVVGAMGATFFLMLAGVSVGLSAGARSRALGRVSAAHAVVRRGWYVFALAFAFRLQAWILGGFPAYSDLFRVDVLNIMGLSIVLAALLWRVAVSASGRCIVFAAAALMTSAVTPLVRMLPLGALPDPVEAYIVPVSGVSNFVLFPWTGLVFAGAFIGVLMDTADSLERESVLASRLGLGGAALIVLGYGLSLSPALLAGGHFWTTSPAYFVMRVGMVMLAVHAAYRWSARGARDAWSPLKQLGKTSLFIYWIHVELVYGIFSRDLHRALRFGETWWAFAAFTACMLLCSIAKDYVSEWRGGRARALAARNVQGAETLLDNRRMTS